MINKKEYLDYVSVVKNNKFYVVVQEIIKIIDSKNYQYRYYDDDFINYDENYIEVSWKEKWADGDSGTIYFPSYLLWFEHVEEYLTIINEIEKQDKLISDLTKKTNEARIQLKIMRNKFKDEIVVLEEQKIEALKDELNILVSKLESINQQKLELEKLNNISSNERGNIKIT